MNDPEKHRLICQRYYLAHREEIISRNRVNRQIKREEINAKAQKKRQDNPEKYKEIRRRSASSDSGKQTIKTWRDNNPGKIAAIRKRYNDNPENKILRQKARQRRCAIDPAFAISLRLRSTLASALKQGRGIKRCRLIELIGCSYAELAIRLERQFLPNMSWANRNEWHIDHIRPCASFDLTDLEQQKQCFHYTNLQPLWAVDNMRKGKKY